MATLETDARYASTFLITIAATSTRTTLRRAAPGDPAANKGPTTTASSRSTADPPATFSGSCPNRVRRNGINSTNVAPSITEATNVATRLATKRSA